LSKEELSEFLVGPVVQLLDFRELLRLRILDIRDLLTLA